MKRSWMALSTIEFRAGAVESQPSGFERVSGSVCKEHDSIRLWVVFQEAPTYRLSKLIRE